MWLQCHKNGRWLKDKAVAVMLGSVDLGDELGIYCKGGGSAAEQWHDLVLKKLLWNVYLSVFSR